MLIYKNKPENANIKVNFILEVIPTFYIFTINGTQYRFSMDKENLDNCPYEKEICDWIDINEDKIKNAIWDWNCGDENKFELIETPLVIPE